MIEPTGLYDALVDALLAYDFACELEVDGDDRTDRWTYGGTERNGHISDPEFEVTARYDALHPNLLLVEVWGADDGHVLIHPGTPTAVVLAILHAALDGAEHTAVDEETAQRGSRALDAVALHHPKWYDKYVRVTTDRTQAVSGRCDTCGINTGVEGCRTWQIANPNTTSS